MPGLYIHVPFCASKCFYCDFYSLAGKTGLFDAYIDAVLAEAQKYREITFDTLFIGGGTPSILGSVRLAALYNGLSEHLDLKNLKEASVEVNPESASSEFLEVAHSLGINRISIGIQSLNDAELMAAGRIHNADTAMRAISRAFHCGFDNISADIIIGLPGQTSETLADTLDQLIHMKLTHISAYCLSIEEHTAFAVNPPCSMVDTDTQADLFEKAVQALKLSGYNHYEISNFALQGRECLHNLNYWKGGEYAGLGPSAASHIKGKRYKNEPNLEKYLDNPLGIVTDEEDLVPEVKMAEEAMLRLRLLEEGLDLKALEVRYASANVSGLKSRLETLQYKNMLVKSGDRYLLPSNLVLVSNQVFADVLS